MKGEILTYVTMENILDKYGIEHKGKKYRCPFHGEDKHPSAAIYGTYFHCFTCSKHLDVIGFIEEYFNLSFKEAMQKINIDFGLGLESNRIDYNKLKQAKMLQNEKKEKKKKLTKEYCTLCNIKRSYENIINGLSHKINIKNWENLVSTISYFEMKLFHVEQQLIDIDNKLSSRI